MESIQFLLPSSQCNAGCWLAGGWLRECWLEGERALPLAGRQGKGFSAGPLGAWISGRLALHKAKSRKAAIFLGRPGVDPPLVWYPAPPATLSARTPPLALLARPRQDLSKIASPPWHRHRHAFRWSPCTLMRAPTAARGR